MSPANYIRPMILDRFLVTDQAAVVTASGRGIGAAAAIAFAQAGADVVLAARTEDQLREVAKQVEAAGRRAHARGETDSMMLPKCRDQAVGTVPPSMTYSVPVMEAARGDARNATRSATSPGLAGRPSGMPPSESITILRPPS